MNREEIIDRYVSGEMQEDEAIRMLVATGLSEDDAGYEIRSLDSVDVR